MIEQLLNECKLCPRNCKINRVTGQIGRCKAGMNVKVALARLHYYEEPCISGKNGSGTVFFSGCNLSCKFCQNYEISCLGKGEEKTIDELAEIFIDLQNQNANNINLVTGFMYVPQIIEAIKIARKKGLKIPIVYNSSGYESLETLKLLDGYIDIYLPDMKYYYKELAKDLSDCENYFEIAQIALKEMERQVGENVLDENGIMKKGMIVRHLILPNHIRNSKMILKWLKQNLSDKIFISVMAQYFPSNKAMETDDINRKLTQEELDIIIEYIDEIGLENGYIQELEDDETKYVPNF